MTVAPRPLRLAALLGFITLLGGCTPPNALRNFDGDPWVKRNAEALDRMAAKLNEYGTVGMSAPLIMTPDKSFDFEIQSHGPEQYFAEAKAEIQARAAALEQDVSLFSLNASANIDPTKTAAYAEQLKNYESERIDYLRQRNERDRALGMAAAAKNTAAQLRRDAALKAAEQIADPQQQAEARAKALEDYATAITAAGGTAPTAPTFPTAQAPSAQSAPTNANSSSTQTQDVLPDAYNKFANPGSFLGQNPTVTSTNRSALITAAGDTAVEGILKALHSTQPSAALLGKKKFFGAAMVSVTPGWRTKTDFAARLTIRPTLTFRPARAEVSDFVIKTLKERYKTTEIRCDQIDAHPSVAGYRLLDRTMSPYSDSISIAVAASAVSPMTDTQNLQLASSLRKRKEFVLQIALALQSAGLDAGAKLFRDHLQDLEKDVMSSNREVPITAYATGSQFGYEIGPELWSQTNPSESKPKPGYRLVRQSFPTLFLLGIEEEEQYPRLDCGTTNNRNREPVVVEPHLKVEQTRRWVPLTERAAASDPIDGEIAALNDEITRAYVSGDACKGENRSVYKNVCSQINARGNALAEELFGSYQQQPLPLCMVVPDLPRCIKEAAREEAEAEKMKTAQAASDAKAKAKTTATATATASTAKAKPATKK